MLVLSRKVGQKILIGDKIEVTVVRLAPGSVRIGIEAPDELPIVREEVQNQGLVSEREIPFQEEPMPRGPSPKA